MNQAPDFISDEEISDHDKNQAPDFVPDEKVPVSLESKAPKVAPDFIPDHEAKNIKSEAPDFISDSDVSDENETSSAAHSTFGQKLLTGAEGVARGLTAGGSDALAAAAEKYGKELGIPEEYLPSTQAMGERRKENPAISLGSEIGGNVLFSTLLPEIKIAQLGKMGAAALRGALSSIAFQTGDEVSNSMLGGDPSPGAASRIAKMGALGLIAGGAGSKIGDIVATNLNRGMRSFVIGAGHAAHFPQEPIVNLANSALTHEAEGLNNSLFKLGQYVYKNKTNFAVASSGHGTILNKIMTDLIEKTVGKQIDKASANIIGPMLMKAASAGQEQGFDQVLNTAMEVSKGQKLINRGVEGLFSSIPQKMFGHEEASSQDQEDLDKQIENMRGNGDSNQKEQKFAKGGNVMPQAPDVMEQDFPDHSMLINSAKTRVFNQLNALKPTNMASSNLPYDSNYKDDHKEKEYKRALGIAAKPLSILSKIKKGNINPEDVSLFKNMYPELHHELSKKITSRILEGKVKGETKPPQNVRQAMSLFLGSNLDSTTLPQNIMAAQMTFAVKNQNSAPPPQSKTNPLSKAGKNSMTYEQARTAKLNR